MHSSVKLETPVEFINLVPVNPLISKCEIKVCYVSDDPNRNRSVISKDTAREMANSLPGSPIVGFYNEETEDFEGHNRTFEITDGNLVFKDATRPYGFVDLGAKVWFQKFLDDGKDEREYLMTEGFLWTGQYPECQRIIDKSNNQSMELDADSVKGSWTKDDNGKPQFFIINEAIISKLCILGEDVEPCFEGASISKVEFSFEDSFKKQLFSMINELKTILNEGGAKVNTYAVEIGSSLFGHLWKFMRDHFSNRPLDIEGFYEESDQKFAILRDCEEGKYYRLNFNVADNDKDFDFSTELVEVDKTFVPAVQPQFSKEELEAYAVQFEKENEKIEDKNEKEFSLENEDNVEGGVLENSVEFTESHEAEPEAQTEDVVVPETFSEAEDGTNKVDAEPEKPEVKYNLEEIPEYIELQSKFSELTTQYEELKNNYESLNTEVEPLKEFKANAERKEKEAMIKSFYMLSDEDKKDVIANIDSYSLDDIEAKLSIICVRNKVNFSLDEEGKEDGTEPMTFNVHEEEDSSAPAWVKAVLATAKKG